STKKRCATSIESRRCGWMTLMATSRPRRRSCARYTVAMPPCPSSSITSYFASDGKRPVRGAEPDAAIVPLYPRNWARADPDDDREVVGRGRHELLREDEIKLALRHLRADAAITRDAAVPAAQPKRCRARARAHAVGARRVVEDFIGRRAARDESALQLVDAR